MLLRPAGYVTALAAAHATGQPHLAYPDTAALAEAARVAAVRARRATWAVALASVAAVLIGGTGPYVLAARAQSQAESDLAAAITATDRRVGAGASLDARRAAAVAQLRARHSSGVHILAAATDAAADRNARLVSAQLGRLT